MKVAHAACALLALVFPIGAGAGEADVLAVQANRAADGRYRFDVTLRHADEGWKHYADRWEILAPDGSVLATRVLLHPHVEDQPFTRSLGQVAIPEGVTRVDVRARDSQHGYGGEQIAVDLGSGD